MRKAVLILAAMLTLSGLAYGKVSVILNGSFENDGWNTDQDILDKAPQKWDEVNVPDNFYGYIGKEWAVDGTHSITLYSDAYSKFEVNDMITIAQKDIYLTDVNHIMFNLKLRTDWLNVNWDPNLFSAFIKIDNIYVWDSNSLPEKGNYEGSVDVNESRFSQFKDGKVHKFILGMRANQKQQWASYIFYIARCDFIRFDTHCDCNGFDYPMGDFDHDCKADWLDLARL